VKKINLFTVFELKSANIIFIQIQGNHRFKILKFTRTSYNFPPAYPKSISTIEMQDNNNGSNLTNGDSHGVDRFANIRAAEERKLLARKNANHNKKIIDQLTKIPIHDDENEDVEKNSGHDSAGTASTPVDADNTDSILLNKNANKKPSHHRIALEAVYARFDVSKKSRMPFLVLSVLCILLFLIVIVLAIVWPYIPSYMRSEVCMEQECFDASKQVIFYLYTYVFIFFSKRS
jgi:hypothetical protein